MANLDEIIRKAKNAEEAQSTFERMEGRKCTADEGLKITQKFPNSLTNTSTNTSTNTNSTTNQTSTGPSTAGNIVGGIQNTISSFETTSLAAASEGTIKVNEIIGGLKSSGGQIKDLSEMFTGLIGAAKGGLDTYYAQQTGLLNDVNKNMALTGTLSKDFRESLSEANVELTKYGISFTDLATAAKNISENSGKFLLYNEQSFNLFGQVGQAFMGGLDKLVASFPEFEKVGIGGRQAAEAMARAGKDALNLGLNSQKVTGMVKDNLEKLNSFGFKDGVDGLSKMVNKSIEFRQNLQEVYNVAKKVMDPAGAVDFAAKMQMMGGAIGAFNDPIKLMYMSTNNVEGLQDALLQTAGTLATYNKEQGRFEINSLNIRRARDMANELDLSYEELTKSAIAFQERASAKTSLLGLEIKDDQKEFITNLARMDNGKMVIDLQGKSFSKDFASVMDAGKVSLEEVARNPKLAEAILKYQDEFKQMNPQEIIANQASDVQTISRYVSFLAARARLEGGQDGKELAKAMGIDGNLTAQIVGAIKSGEVGVKSLNANIKGMLSDNKVDINKITSKVDTNNAATSKSTIETHEKETKNKSTATNTQTNNGDNKMEVNLNIKAPNLTDGWTRETIKNSSIMEGVISSNPKSYTSPTK